MSAPITITAAQRDALWESVRERLSTTDHLGLLVRKYRVAEAKKVARELIEDLCLAEDLNWGEGRREPFELTAPPDVLRRALSRHCHDALTLEAHEIAEHLELDQERDERRERNQEVIATCRRVLAQIDQLDASEAK